MTQHDPLWRVQIQPHNEKRRYWSFLRAKDPDGACHESQRRWGEDSRVVSVDLIPEDRAVDSY